MNHPNETKELLDIVKKVLHKHENPYDYREDIDYDVEEHLIVELYSK